MLTSAYFIYKHRININAIIQHKLSVLSISHPKYSIWSEVYSLNVFLNVQLFITIVFVLITAILGIILSIINFNKHAQFYAPAIKLYCGIYHIFNVFKAVRMTFQYKILCKNVYLFRIIVVLFWKKI